MIPVLFTLCTAVCCRCSIHGDSLSRKLSTKLCSAPIIHKHGTRCAPPAMNGLAVPYLHHTRSDTRKAFTPRLTFAFLGSRTTVLPLLLVVARRATATFTTARARKPLKAFISLYISVCRLLFAVAATAVGVVGVPSGARQVQLRR